MGLIHTQGNLLALAEAGKFDIIVHGCNCQNTMGSGIAKQIKDKYPDAFEVDYQYDLLQKNTRYLKLGNFSKTKVFSKSNFTIVNAYTQFHYLPRGVDHFEYASFAVILQKLAHFYGNYDFGFPYIGMGLAGGDPDTIIQMLEDFTELVEAKSGSVTLVEYST
jgi:O-acetyl-ADP-ribose deacetylase (regulator of RNase III)